MTDLTISQLAGLDVRKYSAEIKSRLRDDEAWAMLLDPILIEKTRFNLSRIILSIDLQKERVMPDSPLYDQWLGSISKLRGYAKARLDAMPPTAPAVVASSKEARAWREFSARLAAALEAGDPSALDRLLTPYGGMSARQWLTARDRKVTKK